MPPIPIMPMNSPWPIHNGQGGPSVEMARPSPIISEPKITVQRVPIRPAIWDMMMPPIPEPSHASELASDGTERDPPISLAMSLSATAVIQAAPNDIARTTSAADATAQEVLVSMEARGDCNIVSATGFAHWSYRPHKFSPPISRRVSSSCCIAQTRANDVGILDWLCIFAISRKANSLPQSAAEYSAHDVTDRPDRASNAAAAGMVRAAVTTIRTVGLAVFRRVSAFVRQRLMLRRVEKTGLGIAVLLLPARNRIAGLIVEFSGNLGVETEPRQPTLHVAALCPGKSDLVFALLRAFIGQRCRVGRR